MKAVRCQNGHWYDSETYTQCPHCGQPGSGTVHHSQEKEKPGKKGFSLFRRNKNAAPVETPVRRDVAEKPEVNHSVSDSDVTERFFADIDEDKTVSMLESGDMTVSALVEEAIEKRPAEVPPAEKRPTSEPLAAAVQRISAMDEGKTLSYFNAMTFAKEPTAAPADTPKVSEPVVGWLVCISGPHLGESFQLYVGKNPVGRNSSNKVVLSLDQSVSRESHAIIIYEPKRREFYLQSGNSDGLVYLNDTFMSGAQIMKAKDVLEVGASKMVFVPLCGPDFSWEQYL